MDFTESTAPQRLLLGKDNYTQWRNVTVSLLKEKDLWGCVIGDPLYVRDVTKEYTARQIIMDLVGDIADCVCDTITSQEAWNKLESIFGAIGLAAEVGMLRDLAMAYLVDYPSMKEYVDKVINMCLTLRMEGHNISDYCITVQLLAGLPDNYWFLVLLLDSRPDLSYESVKTILLVCAKKKAFSYTQRCTSDSAVTTTSDNFSQHIVTPFTSIWNKDQWIEIQGRYRELYEIFVSNIFPSQVEVTFTTKRQGRAKVTYSNVRLSSGKNVEVVLKGGKELDIYTRVCDNCPFGSWKAAIYVNQFNRFMIVDVLAWNLSKQKRFESEECVQMSHLRVTFKNTSTDGKIFFKRQVCAPTDVKRIAKNNCLDQDFRSLIGPSICNYILENSILRLITDKKNLKSLGQWTERVHFTDNLARKSYMDKMKSKM